MKKILCLLLLLLPLCVGCDKNEVQSDAPVFENIGLSDEAQEEPVEEELTEEAVIELFSSRADYEAQDCTLAEDSAYGLIGVVQYADEGGCPFNLAFVSEDGYFQTVGLDAEAAYDSDLTYIGSGAVTFSLTDKDAGEIFDYKVEYSTDDLGVHFKAFSEPRE